MSFLGVLETVGKDFAKGLSWAVTYSVPVEKLLVLLFPELQPEAAGAVTALTLIQNAVLMVEQKNTAMGAQGGSGAQKLNEVLLLAGGAATSLLEKAGVTVSQEYLEHLTSAVVSILNVQQMPAATTAQAG